jgi:hypothetical protein
MNEEENEKESETEMVIEFSETEMIAIEEEALETGLSVNDVLQRIVARHLEWREVRCR